MCDASTSSRRPCNPALKRQGLLSQQSVPTAAAWNWERKKDGGSTRSGATSRLFKTALPTPRPRPRQSPSDTGDSATNSSSDSLLSGPAVPPESSSDQSQPPVSGQDSSVPPSSIPPSSSSSQQSTSTSLSPSSPPPSSLPSSQQSSSSSSSPPSSFSSTSSSTPSSPTQSSSSTTPQPITPTSTSDTSSSSPPPTSSLPTNAGDVIQTTIYSTIVTEVNGVQTTLTTAIPTTLPITRDSTPMSASTRRAIITGSAIGGTVFFVILLVLFLFCKRSSKLRLNYKKLRVFGNRRRRTMLLDEDDDFDMGDPGMQRYTDNPAGRPSSYPTSLSSSRSHGQVFTVPGAGPGPVPSPHLLGLRASESGSIFREAVWPPPGEGSRFVDPIVAGSSEVDLGRIVRDVMGPNTLTSSTHPMNPILNSSQVTIQPSVAIASGVGMHSRATSSTRLLPSPPFQSPTHSFPEEPPSYDTDDEHREMELGRAQSPDSQVYSMRSAPLRITNAGPESPLSPPNAFANVSGSPNKNWLGRAPKSVQERDEEVVMGEAI